MSAGGESWLGLGRRASPHSDEREHRPNMARPAFRYGLDLAPDQRVPYSYPAATRHPPPPGKCRIGAATRL